MNSVVYVPLVASLLVVPLTRWAAKYLWPRAAVWAISLSSVILAVSTVGALVVLASPLPAQLPFIAVAGHWRPGAVASHSPVPWEVSAIALAALVVMACRLVREGRALLDEVGSAARVSRATRRHGEVVLLDDANHGAHAIGLGVTGRGAIVISSRLLELLDEEEQAAVIAHERTHLRQRHALFSAAMRLAAALDPALVPTRRDLDFALERAADEVAAQVTDRSVVASALAKSALAVLGRNPVSAVGFAFHRHGLTDRVAAMLDEPTGRVRPAWALVAVAAAAGLALAWATHDTERFFEAVRLWSRP
jgi:Zn-dependent protease with chaperone function